MYFLYSLALLVYALLVTPRLLYDAIRYGKYRGTLAERCGQLPPEINTDRKPSIWVHAVSVGEVLATRTLIPALRQRYPGHSLWMSTTTQSGRAVAAQIEGVDGLFYFPLDLVPVVHRVLDQVRPALFITVDTELWPNLVRHCRLRGIKTVLVNGRISDRSFPRYRLIRPFFRKVLVGIDRCCAQSDESGRRLVELGAPGDHVVVTGNLKFDTLSTPATGSPPEADSVLRRFCVSPERMVLIAASTHKGEEVCVLEAFSRITRRHPTALLVMAPRHPERAREVLRQAEGLGFDAVYRSELSVDAAPSAPVVVLDTVGELATLLQRATVVFLGGTLVPVGGHNLLEPAAWGKPVVFGPHMENFAEIASLFVSRRAALQIGSSEELELTLMDLLDDPEKRRDLGTAAVALLAAHRGATERTLAEIEMGWPGGYGAAATLEPAV